MVHVWVVVYCEAYQAMPVGPFPAHASSRPFGAQLVGAFTLIWLTYCVWLLVFLLPVQTIMHVLLEGSPHPAQLLTWPSANAGLATASEAVTATAASNTA